MRHKNNDLVTLSPFTFGALPPRSMRHKTITWRPHRGSHSARCRHGRCDTKTITWRPHRGSHSARWRHGRLETKNNSTTPSRFTIGALLSRSMRHENNDWMIPSRFTMGSLSPQLIRHKNKDAMTPSRITVESLSSRSMRLNTMTWRPHRGSQLTICAMTVGATQKQVLDDPHRCSQKSYSFHHGRCGT